MGGTVLQLRSRFVGLPTIVSGDKWCPLEGDAQQRLERSIENGVVGLVFDISEKHCEGRMRSRAERKVFPLNEH
jgi:hypothetical protein